MSNLGIMNQYTAWDKKRKAKKAAAALDKELSGQPINITITARLYPKGQGNRFILDKLNNGVVDVNFINETLTPTGNTDTADQEQALLNLLGTNPIPVTNGSPAASNVSPTASNVSPTASNVSPAGAPAGPTTGDAAASNVSPTASNVSPAGPTTGDAASNEPTNMLGNFTNLFSFSNKKDSSKLASTLTNAGTTQGFEGGLISTRGGRNMRRTRGGRRRTQNKKKQYRRSKKYRY
jgi:hypothetical protein